VASAASSSTRPDRPRQHPASSDVDRVLAAVRAAGGTVVATGGCFDLLHPGHLATLEVARGLGDCLIVLLNSDDSVRRLKGSGRPLQDESDRARLLAALGPVDAVVIFDEDTPVDALRRIRPDVWVKGGDYAGTELPETQLLRSWGGEVVTVPYLPGRSTSTLVELSRR
jgi:D-beta-D-heptose 7-phosphate kinase / D-beta-D-heptose 1-phosphate adenosyltransferase